jgi:hypothetical protein
MMVEIQENTKKNKNKKDETSDHWSDKLQDVRFLNFYKVF